MAFRKSEDPIVVRGRESRPHGEGGNGNSAPIKGQPAPDKVGLEHDGITSLSGIANKASTHRQHRYQNLYRLINVESLNRAWKRLNKKASAGIDKITIEGLEMKLSTVIESKDTLVTRALDRIRAADQNGELKHDFNQRTAIRIAGHVWALIDLAPVFSTWFRVDLDFSQISEWEDAIPYLINDPGIERAALVESMFDQMSWHMVTAMDLIKEPI